MIDNVLLFIVSAAVIGFAGFPLFSGPPSVERGGKKKPNHLINEKSPYLLQHAENPVDWHPWGDAAILRAKRENKPILLSIGYSTCHWCHVMEKESFENEDIARIMNEHYVCIKVDREERPDLDNIYMSAVTALTGSGGWPLNVFLTPDLKPFFGGTYFPADSGYQMISWPDLLLRIVRIWNDPMERAKLLQTGEKLQASLVTHLSMPNRNESPTTLNLEPVVRGVRRYAARYDARFGGFGEPPKFPSPVIQNYLLARYRRLIKDNGPVPEAVKILSMVETTLGAMIRGGIFDQVGGGFHRYATDGKWHVPHFEKMLYDNAQMLINCLDAWVITKNDLYKYAAKATADYLIRDLSGPEGAFYSAEDADSLPMEGSIQDKKEGAFYVWEMSELENLLDKRSLEVFNDFYGVRGEGNVESDPHGEFKGKNILFRSGTVKKTAGRFDLDVIKVNEILEAGLKTLYRERCKRPRPHLDDKILSSWNGLAVSAMSRAWQVLEEKKYLDAARNAAFFIRDHLYDAQEKKLYRRWRGGERKYSGIAEDYAFFTQGLIDLYESDGDPGWLELALDLTDIQTAEFHDKVHGGYFMTADSDDDHLIVRVKEENDSVMPSANAVSACNLIRLSRYLNREDLHQMAEGAIAYFFDKINRFPEAMPQMLVALQMHLTAPVQIVIVSEKPSETAEAMARSARSAFIPGKMIIKMDDDETRRRMTRHLPFVEAMKPVGGLSAAYVCNDFSCKAPITDPDEFKKILDGVESV